MIRTTKDRVPAMSDELLEATPGHLRLRKRILDPHERKRSVKTAKAEAGL